MTTFSIYCRYNDEQANFFKRRWGVVARRMPMRQAQRFLLALYNDLNDDRPDAPNWGAAVRQTDRRVDFCTPTAPDGTRSFTYDGSRYIIVSEDLTAEELRSLYGIYVPKH